MEENTSQSPLIAIRLIDGTRILASKFRVGPDNIFIDDVKYMGDDDTPIFLEDSMLLQMDAIETYLILHKGEKNAEISENRDDPPAST